MLNWRTKKPSQNVQPKYSGKKIFLTIRYFVFKHIGTIFLHNLLFLRCRCLTNNTNFVT